MDYLSPASLPDALAAKASFPEAVPVTGGTDVMVDVNFGRRRPPALLDLSRVEELKRWEVGGATVRLGASVTYTQVCEAMGRVAPALALAARTVGSPQIRNRGTVGGNLGSASPAGDALPPLLASGASVEVASVSGTRLIPVSDFFRGPKRNVLRPDEIITAVEFPSAGGPQQFAKVGPRNAMVIAVASFALALWPRTGRVATGVGSAAPTPVRARGAEEFLQAELAERALWDRPSPLAPGLVTRFGELVAGSATPIDDIRGSARYRRHCLGVIAGRTLTWAWGEYLATREGA